MGMDSLGATESRPGSPEATAGSDSRIRDYVRSTHSIDGAVILDIVHGQMFHLNLVGSRILELLKKGSAESEIAEQIACEFGIDQRIARSDIRDFLDDLEKHKLLRERTS